MISWQVLRSSRTSRSAPDYCYQHGAGGSMHDCTAAAVPAAPGGSGSSFLSREKVSLQQLNRRLASYLQQVKHLEAANQRLEHQIQEELDRKCPKELRQLDGHLKTASLLQDQISECLSAQAQLKLQLLEAELTVFDLSERCKKECERRTHLEVELSDLRLLGEVLKAHNLPELQNLLNEQMQEMEDLQIRHQQDMQVLLAEVTGGVAVERHTAESSDLIQQVEHLRRSESWFKTQVSHIQACMPSFDSSAGSEADRAKLEALRREVDHLATELTQLQAVVLVLEASGREQTESLLQQLVVLQRTADGLSRDLDSVLQAADHQSLLDIKSQLEAEIQDYKKLLDGLGHEGDSCVHFNAKPDARSSHLATSPLTFRRNIMVDRTVSVQGGHAHTVGKTPVAAPLSKTVTASQSVFVHNKHPTLTNPLVESFQKPDNQRTGVLSEKMSKSIISTETVSSQSCPVENEVHAKDHDVQSSIFAGAQISQEIPNKRAFVKASKTEITTTLDPDSTDTIQTKQETLISKQAGSQSSGRGTNIRVETNKTILCAEAVKNEQPHFETKFDLFSPTTPEVQVDPPEVVDPPESSFHATKKNPTQIMTSEAETSPETVKDMNETASTIHGASGSSWVDRSTTVQGEVCGEVALMEDTDEGVDGKSGKEIVEGESVLSLDQSLGISKNQPNKLTEDKNTRYNNENTSSGIPENNNKFYSKTASTGNLNEEMDKVEEVHYHTEVKMNPVHSDNESLSTTSSETSTHLTDSAVALSSSSPEEHQSPKEAELMSPTKSDECLNPEMSPVKSSHEPEIYLSPNDPDTCLIPTDVRTEVNNRDVHRQRKRGTEEAEDTLLVLSLAKSLAHMSNMKLMKDAESWSSIAVSCPESKENLKSKTQTTEVLKTEVDEMEIVSNANKVKMDPAKSNKETVDLAGEEVPKHSTSLTDSGVGLSCSSYEEFLSPEEVRLSANETKPPRTENLNDVVDKVEEVYDCKEVKMNPFQPDNEQVNLQNQEILVSTGSSETSTDLTDSVVALSSSSSEEHQSPREAELMSPTKSDECLNPEMCPVKSSHEPEIYLSPNDPDTCLIPTEVKTEVNNGDVHRQRKRGTEEAEDTLFVLSLDKSLAHMSNMKFMKDAESWSSIAVSCPESKENLKSKTQTTEVLKAEVDEMEIVSNANKVKMDPAKSNKEMVDLAGEEVPKHSTSLTDSGVGLSCSSYEEFLSPEEVRLSASETKPPCCFSPEICLSLVETEVMLSLTDEAFYPVDVEDHITSPDLLLSPNEPENYLSPNDSDTCLSPKNDEEDEAISLSLTKANAHVRPIEKYILSTKEEGQSVLFSGDRTLPEDRNVKVIISEGDRDVCFRPFECHEGRGVNLNGTKLSSKLRPTSQSSDLQVSSSHAGLAFGDGRSIIADREEQLGFGGLYRKRDARRTRGKYASGTPDEDKIERVTMDSDARSFGSVPFSKGTTSSKLGGRVSNSGDTQVTTAGIKERVRCANGEWKVYSGSKEYLTERGRFGSGEWIDYCGSLRRKSSLDAGTKLPSEGNGESSSINGKLATSPPETGSFGRRGSGGSGEWIVYGGSLGRTGNWAGSDSSLNADSKECLPTAMNMARSPPGAGRLGSREWKLYGWRPGCMSIDSEDCPSEAMQLATSPPGTSGAGRFVSGGSVVYGGSTGHMSRSSSADRASVSRSQTISPPSSYTSSRRRLSSAGSAGKLSSGSVVRRSSSVGIAGWGGGGRTTNSPRALSPGGRIGVSGGSSGWLSSSKAAGSGSKLRSAGSNDKLSSYTGGRICGSPGSGRTNSTGGRVISSSDRPIRSTGSGAGSSKERISVCKMAALSMSAAGRERSQERQRQAERVQQQQTAAPALADLRSRGHKL
ncbi:uncharacterized protein LOC115783966 [Archocentrus centrarchus]|uniref:uncharacterized protein LOC115783966 n=1 Tax=Archocentrus centrarchus TaxID=63155 RepID=UPI0011EA1103|nr:uncharacterized protein LOC115783966 [Archocentrus centrarchus]